MTPELWALTHEAWVEPGGAWGLGPPAAPPTPLQGAGLWALHLHRGAQDFPETVASASCLKPQTQIIFNLPGSFNRTIQC